MVTSASFIPFVSSGKTFYSCFWINSNNVELNGGGHSLTGLGPLTGPGFGGLDNSAVAIQSNTIGGWNKSIIRNFVIAGFGRGIAVRGFFHQVQNNTVSNTQEALHLASNTQNSTLVGNTAFNNRAGNGRGVVLYWYSTDPASRFNNITGNEILNNIWGIDLGVQTQASHNYFYNNIVANNTVNARDPSGLNFYNATKTAGRNIVGGPFTGGNFWNDYKGQDLDGDGLGDTLLPYNSTGYISKGGDFQPLVTRHVWPQHVAVGSEQSPTTVYVTVVATFNETGVRMDMLNNTLNPDGDYSMMINITRVGSVMPGNLNLTVSTTLGIPAVGNLTLYVREIVLGIIAQTVIKVVPTNVLFSNKGLVATLRTYLNYSNVELKMIPPKLYNLTRFWINSTNPSPLTLGIRMNNTGVQTFYNASLSFNPPIGINLNIAPTLRSYGNLTAGSSNIAFFNVTTNNVPVGRYNMTYAFRYSNVTGAQQALNGVVPAGVFLGRATWFSTNNSAVVNLTTPFDDNETAVLYNYTTITSADGVSVPILQNGNSSATLSTLSGSLHSPLWWEVGVFAAAVVIEYLTLKAEGKPSSVAAWGAIWAQRWAPLGIALPPLAEATGLLKSLEAISTLKVSVKLLDIKDLAIDILKQIATKVFNQYTLEGTGKRPSGETQTIKPPFFIWKGDPGPDPLRPLGSFTQSKFSLTLIASPGGTTFVVGASPTTSTFVAPAGIVLNVFAVPNAGYVFDHWQFDDCGPICEISGSPISVTMNKDVYGFWNIKKADGELAIIQTSKGTAVLKAVFTGDYTISATSPASVNIGSSATSTITVTALDSFTGPVTLTDTVPAGLSCGLISPSSVVLPSSPATATLTCSSPTVGNFAVKVNGTSGSLVHSTVATFTFGKAGPSITTAIVPSSTITVGSSISDTAALSGGFSPITGTVTYTLFTGGTCGGAVVTSQTVTVSSGNTVPQTSPVTPVPAGSYSFQAVYNGDTNNNPSTSICEPLTVQKVSPVITTSISPSATIVVGNSVMDTATLSGGFPAAGITGTVSYFFFTNGGCTGTGNVVSTVTVGAGNSVPPSSSVTPPAAGSFSLYAVYNGDSNNNAFTSSCEPLSVKPATPAITTALSAGSITLGQSIADTATLSNGFNPSGTITFEVFVPSDTACLLPPVFTSVKTAAGNGAYVSTLFTASTSGTFQWTALYGGDSNNNARITSCGAEPLTVNSPPPLPNHSLTIGASTGGSTNPSQGTHSYVYGTVVNVTALPTGGYYIDHWVLDGVSVQPINPINVTMSADHMLTAVFATSPPPPPIICCYVPSYTLTISSGGGGTTNPGGVFSLAPGDIVTIYAIPSSGMVLASWTIDGFNYGPANPVSVLMDTSHILSANFAAPPPPPPAGPVGGVLVPVDKLALLAPFVGLASLIVVATTVTAIYVRRAKRRREAVNKTRTTPEKSRFCV